VVDVVQPFGELRFEIIEVAESPYEQEAVLDEADQALDRALLIARARRAQGRDHAALGDCLAKVHAPRDRDHLDRRIVISRIGAS
jgi:hypothetical protein